MISHARASNAERAESILLGAAGIAVLATARLRWVSEGPGSTLHGQDLAASLRNGVLVPDWGAHLAAGMYLLVALGGLLIASSGFRGRAVVIVRLFVGILVAVPFAVGVAAGWYPPSRWSFGPTLVVGACAVAVVVSSRQLRRTHDDSSRRRTRPMT